jgi:hypothetical protein
MSEASKYAAFISYSSKDAAFARRLHRTLEGYSIPGALGEFRLSATAPRNRLYPIFRDREELPSGELAKVIDEAITASGSLIIVCSPNAAASPWVNKEIETFLKLGRRDRIFAIMTDDAPVATTDGADATELSFPAAFKGERHDAGFTPVVGDARPGKDGFRHAWLKVAAGIAGTNLGSLQDRDAKRRVQRTLALSGITVALIAVLAGLLASLSIQNVNAWASRSQQAAQLAEEALDENRPEDALLLALAGLPSGRGHSLVSPDANGVIILERALNEIMVTRAAEPKRRVGMMEMDYEPRPLGEQRVQYARGENAGHDFMPTRFGQIDVETRDDYTRTSFTRHGETAPFAEVDTVIVGGFVEAPAPSTLLAVFGNRGVAFIDTAGSQPACYAFGARQIYHITMLGPSRALVSLSPYKPHFIVFDIDACTPEGDPFAIVVPYVPTDDDSYGRSQNALSPNAFEVIPLTFVPFGQGNVPDDTELRVAPEHVDKLAVASGLNGTIGLSQTRALLSFLGAPDRLILFDVAVRQVLGATTLPQVNSNMGGESADDYLTDVDAGLVINLNAGRGVILGETATAFAIPTVTDLTSARLGCEGWCLETTGWSFDLRRAASVASGVPGSSEEWRRAQQATLARRMMPDVGREIPNPELDNHPAFGPARRLLTDWFNDVGIGLIDYDLDGRYPDYFMASSADGSLVAITNGEQVWLRSADGSIARRLTTNFPEPDRARARLVWDGREDEEDRETVRLAMAPDGAWLAALGPHDETMQQLIVWDVASNRRLFSGLISSSRTLDVVAGKKGVWLDNARQILFAATPDFQSLFTAACERRPEGRRTLAPQVLRDLGLGPSDADPCRNRFVFEHLWSEVVR